MKATTEKRGSWPVVEEEERPKLMAATDRATMLKHQKDAIRQLHELVKEGSTVYTTMKHRARSGRMAIYKPWIVVAYEIEQDPEPMDLTRLMCDACGLRYNRKHHGIELVGFGVTGLDLVEALSFALHGDSGEEAGRTLLHAEF